MTNWLDDFNQIDWTDDGEGDFFNQSMGNMSDLDQWSRNSPLSSRWSYARTKKDDARDVVMELIKIRTTVAKLLQVHGIPKNTTIDLACLGEIGKGIAGFHDIGIWQMPFIKLDTAVYEDCEAHEVLDIYCGIGLHEASHLKHTREMFIRLRHGTLTGDRKLWEGLWEDERIELFVREESPGFAGYIHSVKRALFDKKEFGFAVDKWGDPNTPPTDIDRICMIVFAFIRCGHRLTEEMKVWKTLKGRTPFEELRTMFPDIPRSEKKVQSYGQKLMDWFDSHRKDYDELIKQKQDEPGQGDPQPDQNEQDGDPQESMDDASTGEGDSQQGDGDPSEQGKQQEPSNDAQPQDGEDTPDTPPEEGDAGQDGSESESGESDGDPQDGESDEDGQGDQQRQSDQPGEQSSGQSSGQPVDGPDNGSHDGQPTAREFSDRLNSQEASDDWDANDKGEREALDTLINDRSRLLDQVKEAKDSKKVKENPDLKDEVEDFDKQREALEDKIKKLVEKRIKEGRFGIDDLRRMIQRIEIIDKPLDAGETEQLGEVESLRVELGPEWKPDSTTEAGKSIIHHPEVDDQIIEKYDSYKESVKGHIARMRQVFRFRLGQRMWRQRERLSGKLDRRKLATANQNPRIFYNEKTRTDQGIAIGILMDESGSMGHAGMTPTEGGRGIFNRRRDRDRDNNSEIGKAASALQLGILMSEALMGLPGVELEVYSFTSCRGHNADTQFKYLYGANNKDRRAIADYGHGASNYDYQAIITAADQMKKHCKEEKKLLIVLSDGAPCGRHGNYSAQQLTKMAVDQTRREGFQVLQVAIEDYMESDNMYGAKNVLKFTNIDKFIEQMRTLITRVIRQVTNV